MIDRKALNKSVGNSLHDYEMANRGNSSSMNDKSSTEIRLYDIEPHVGRKLDDVERDLILKTLARCGGNRTWAADVLGISIRTMRNKLLRYQESDAMPGRAGRATKLETETHAARLEAFEPGRRLPS